MVAQVILQAVSGQTKLTCATTTKNILTKQIHFDEQWTRQIHWTDETNRAQVALQVICLKRLLHLNEAALLHNI